MSITAYEEMMNRGELAQSSGIFFSSSAQEKEMLRFFNLKKEIIDGWMDKSLRNVRSCSQAAPLIARRTRGRTEIRQANVQTNKH